MPLTITTSITPTGSPMLEGAAAVQARAVAQGSVIPPGGSAIAITIPIVTVDQTGLNYNTRAGNTEFLFNTGELKLTLRNEIHMSNGLSPCARTIWLQHEQKHVTDNEGLMSKMDGELRADSTIKGILVSPTLWRPVPTFNAVQTSIRIAVQDVFRRLTAAAAAKQDTLKEYGHVDGQIKIRCGFSITGVLSVGMYGKGIDLVQLALNGKSPTMLARLKVDGVFGPVMEKRVKEFQNFIGLVENDGTVGEKTRKALGIF